MNIRKFINSLTSDAFDEKRSTIILTEKYFDQSHNAISGRNGMSTLVDLKEVVSEIDDIYCEKSNKYGLLSIYFNIPTLKQPEEHSMLVEFKLGNKNNKCIIRPDATTWLHHLFAFNTTFHKAMPTYFEHFKKTFMKSEDSVEFGKNFLKELDNEINYPLEFERQIHSELKGMNPEHIIETDIFKSLCEYNKVEIKYTFMFNKQISCRPEYFIETNNGIEVGYLNIMTYNTIPRVFRIEKIKKLPTTLLLELGLEWQGHYDHSDKFQVLNSQVEEVKSFNAKYLKNKKKFLNNVIAKVSK